MTITFLGTGTSQGVPMIGCDCKVCRSTDKKDKRLRSSALIEVMDRYIQIDTGPDFRYQMLRAQVPKLDAVLFTHEHKDHIAGLDDIRGFNYKMKKAVDLYADERVQEALRREFYYIFSDHRYPGIPDVNLHPVKRSPFLLADGPLVTPIDVMHYKLPIKGYRIGELTYITDAKTISPPELEKIKGSKVLVINALQQEAHLSHLTLSEAVELAAEIGADETYFTHISHRMGKHEEVSRLLPEGMHLAYDTLQVTC